MMIPSTRLIRILAASSALWLLAGFMPGGWLPAVLVLALVATLSARDILSAPKPADIAVARHLPERLSLGDQRQLSLEIHNRTDQFLTVRFRDELPDALVLESTTPEIELPPRHKVLASYSARAVRRGNHEFGRIILRVQHHGGLVLTELAYSASDRIKVYPAYRGVDDYDLLARIDERHEAARKPRRLQGAETDFESLRPYVPGEDPRGIDWKASAHRGALISRNRQVERGQQVALLLDCGRLMGESVDGVSKLDHAMNAAIMLGHVVQRRGDTFSMGCFSNRIEVFVPPLRGSAIVPRVLDALCPVTVREVESDYWQVIAEAMGLLRRRSLVIMITDVLDATASAGLVNNLHRAASRHLVLCVVFTHRNIAEAADSIPVGREDLYRKVAALDLARRRRLAMESMRSRGIHVLEADPRRFSIQLVRRYFQMRKGGLQ